MIKDNSIANGDRVFYFQRWKCEFFVRIQDFQYFSQAVSSIV